MRDIKEQKLVDNISVGESGDRLTRPSKVSSQMFLFRSYRIEDPDLDVNGSVARFTDIYGLKETPRGHCILSSNEIFIADEADLSLRDDHDSNEMELSRANQPYYVHDSCEGMLLISMESKLVVYNPFIHQWGRILELDDIKLTEGKTVCAFFVTREVSNREFKILYRSTNAFNIYFLNTKTLRVVLRGDEIGSVTTPLSSCLVNVLKYGFSIAAVKHEPWMCRYHGDHQSHQTLFFDTKTEGFELVDMPQIPNELTVFQLLTMKGKLAAAVYNSNPDNLDLPLEQRVVGWPSSSIDLWVLEDKTTGLWMKHFSIEPPGTNLLKANCYIGDLEYDVLLGDDAETVLLPCSGDLLVCALYWSIIKKIGKVNHRVIPLCLSIEEGLDTHLWLDQREVPFIFSRSDTDSQEDEEGSEGSSGDSAEDSVGDADNDGDGAGEDAAGDLTGDGSVVVDADGDGAGNESDGDGAGDESDGDGAGDASDGDHTDEDSESYDSSDSPHGGRQ